MKRLLVLALLSTAPAWAIPPIHDTEDRVNELLKQLTLAEKLTLLGGHHDFHTHGIPRLGIPELKMSDGPMGVHDYGLTTAYPAPVGLAASWDVELARRVGDSLGRDARALGVNVLLAPGMNLYRVPMNGRNFEYLGEDPCLAGRIATAEIQGIQGRGVAATAKHFIANNSEEGRSSNSSDLDERTMRELYLPAFEACVQNGHVAALMDAYNLVNGTYMTANGDLNTVIAKQEWGFAGVVMSDWDAVHDGLAAARGGLDLEMPSARYMNPELLTKALADGQLTQEQLDDKVRRILRLTLDYAQPALPLSTFSQPGRDVALEAAREGMVLLKNQGNLLPLSRKRHRRVVVLGPNAYPAVPGGNGSSMTESFVKVSMLEGISGVAGTGVEVLYAQPAADMDLVVNGTRFTDLKAEYFDNANLEGAPVFKRDEPRPELLPGEGSYRPGGPTDKFSARWTGVFTPPTDDDYRFFTAADDGVRLWVDDTLLIDNWKNNSEAVRSAAVHLKAGKPARIKVEYYDVWGVASLRFGVTRGGSGLDEATRRQIAEADAVVVCAGFSPATEGEAWDRTFQLPPGQNALISEAAALNPKTIVTLTGGGNVDMEPWIDKVAALVHVWYPGQEGGTALGQLLWGDHNFSGKLPASFERAWSDNPAHDHYKPEPGGNHVRYAEGLSMGYRFYDSHDVKPRYPFGYGLSYTKFSYSGLQVSPTEASFTVKNIGSRAGAEVAQLYVSDGHSALPRPVKELKGFARVDLRPGQSQRVRLPLYHRAFSYWDPARHDWRADPGQFGILVGSSSTDIRLRGTLDLPNP